MQKTTNLLLGLSLLTFTFPVSASAAAQKGERAGKRAEQREMRQTLKRFDTDKNGQIDGTERDALRKWFADFKALDKNSDGTLDDTEIDALKIHNASKAGKGTKGKARKAGNKDAPATS